MLDLILCVDNAGLYSRKGDMPWKFDEVDQYFLDKTSSYNKISDKKNVVVMGSNTWRSLQQPIDDRITVVISKHSEYIKKSNTNPDYIMSSFEELLYSCKPGNQFYNYNLFVIGGRKLMSYVIRHYSKFIRNVFTMVIRNSFPLQLNDSLLQLSNFPELSLRKTCGFILQKCQNKIDNKLYDIDFIQYFNLESDEELPSKILNENFKPTTNSISQMNVMKLVSFNSEHTTDTYSNLMDVELYQNSHYHSNEKKCCHCLKTTSNSSSHSNEQTNDSWFCNSCIEDKCRCIFC